VEFFFFLPYTFFVLARLGKKKKQWVWVSRLRIGPSAPFAAKSITAPPAGCAPLRSRAVVTHCPRRERPNKHFPGIAPCVQRPTSGRRFSKCRALRPRSRNGSNDPPAPTCRKPGFSGHGLFEDESPLDVPPTPPAARGDQPSGRWRSRPGGRPASNRRELPAYFGQHAFFPGPFHGNGDQAQEALPDRPLFEAPLRDRWSSMSRLPCHQMIRS